MHLLTRHKSCPKRTDLLLILTVFLTLALGLALSACSTHPPADPAPGSELPPIAVTPVAPARPALAVTTTVTTSEPLVLVWWTPEFISPRAPDASGPLLADYLTQFETARAGSIRINPVLKARYGKGGLLDFLRTAQAAAPTVLPDLVALDLAELEQAHRLGLLQPLDQLLRPALIDSLYPFAREAASFEGQLWAYPFASDLEHVIYDRTRLQNPPLTWPSVLAQRSPYVFPVGSPSHVGITGQVEDVQPAFVSQYLSAGGRIDAATRELVLEEQPLLRVLTFYQALQDVDILPDTALKIADLEETWQVYDQGLISMANVSARRYLAEQENGNDTGYAALPGYEAPAAPVARGWALAIVTPDPARRQAAAELLAWLAAPEPSARWIRAAGWLPVAPQDWAYWDSGAYQAFLQGQLEVAVARPLGAPLSPTAAQLRKAIVAVLKDGVTPQQAVQAALHPAPAK